MVTVLEHFKLMIFPPTNSFYSCVNLFGIGYRLLSFLTVSDPQRGKKVKLIFVSVGFVCLFLINLLAFIPFCWIWQRRERLWSPADSMEMDSGWRKEPKFLSVLERRAEGPAQVCRGAVSCYGTAHQRGPGASTPFLRWDSSEKLSLGCLSSPSAGKAKCNNSDIYLPYENNQRKNIVHFSFYIETKRM